jgi:DNA topoisomerase-1
MEIGRPSTYASIIDKIQNRGYVEIKNVEGIKKTVKTFRFKTELKEESKEIMYGKENSKFVPTELGYEVLEFMETYFPYIIDYEFTANMEKKLDDIANGKITKVQIMGEFYKKLVAEIAKVSIKGEKVTISSDKLLGTNKDDGLTYYITKTKFGDAIKWEEGGETKYKSLKFIDIPVNNITLDSCLAFIKYPIDLGEDIKLYKNSKNGTLYIGCNKKYYTVSNENITLEDAKKVIADGGIKDGGKVYPFELSKDIKLGKNKKNGQFYLIHKGKFYSAPNDKITLAEAKKIIETKK